MLIKIGYPNVVTIMVSFVKLILCIWKAVKPFKMPIKTLYIICVSFPQVQQANVDDEEIARAINSKLGETPGISYSEIASKAVDCGRTQLAIKVDVVILTNWSQFFMRLSCYWSWISQ